MRTKNKSFGGVGIIDSEDFLSVAIKMGVRHPLEIILQFDILSGLPQIMS